MSDRPRFFDDLAGVAGGAMSALAGLREEAEAMVRARIDEAIRKLDLVRREELDAMAELAANARAGQEAAEAQAGASWRPGSRCWRRGSARWRPRRRERCEVRLEGKAPPPLEGGGWGEGSVLQDPSPQGNRICHYSRPRIRGGLSAHASAKHDSDDCPAGACGRHEKARINADEQ